MSGKWLALFLIVTAIAPFAIWYYNNELGVPARVEAVPIASIQFHQAEVHNMEPGAEFAVHSINVLDGYRFNLLLNNGQWIEAHLTSAAKDEATPVVVDILKTGSYPSVVLYRKVDKYWIVDLRLDLQEGRHNLVYLLQTQGLTY